MSILFIDDIIFSNSSIDYDNCLVFILLNSVSFISALVFYYILKRNPKLNNHQNSLIVIKLFIEFSVSFCLLILFLSFYLSETVKINVFVKLAVTLSPMTVLASFYWNACMSHNIYVSYYDYRKSYEKRFLFYKISTILISFLIYLFTLFNLNFDFIGDEHMQMSLILYNIKFVNLFYLLVFGLTIYITHKIYYILKKKNDYLTLGKDKRDLTIKILVNSLVKRHIFSICFFIFSYFPNNLIMIIRVTFGYEDFSNFYVSFVSLIFISLSTFASLVVKLTDPYMVIYVKTMFSNSFKEKLLEADTDKHVELNVIKKEEIKTTIKPKGVPLEDYDNVSSGKESVSNSVRSDDILMRGGNNKISSNTLIGEFFDTFDLMNYHLDLSDNIARMIGIIVSLNEDRFYDSNYSYRRQFNSPLPWIDKKFYMEKKPSIEISQDSLPDWIKGKRDPRFKTIKVRLVKYCPLVFHHIRRIDQIAIDDVIQSLDPIKNLEMIHKLKVKGGRGGNSIFTTWDNKFIIKTISTQEKTLFKKEMIETYHARMRDTKSILCRIYGLYKIEISEHINSYVILMKNMNDLPMKTHKLTFDLKGSTVDRQCVSSGDEELLALGEIKDKVIPKYKDKVLKDKDLSLFDIKFNLTSSDAINFVTCVENDSYFLEKFSITDYSLLLFVHDFQEEDYRNNFRNLRVMKSTDDKYLYSFSIIDILSTYDLGKQGEKLTKNLVSLMRRSKDKNFSVQEPKRYGVRFRNFLRKLVVVEDK